MKRVRKNYKKSLFAVYNTFFKNLSSISLFQIENLIKAKSALSQVDNMLVTTTTNLDGENVCEFIFGDES